MPGNSPFTTVPPGGPTGAPVPGAPGGSQFGQTPGGGFNSQQQLAWDVAFHQNPDLAGVWDAAKGLGGDVWGAITGILPKNADGSIDWGKVGSNVSQFIKDHKGDIVDALNVYSQYQQGQRQQERYQKSDEYAQKAVAGKEKSYAAKETLRVAGQAGMLDPSKNTPDLSGLRTQGQAGASMLAPLPVAASNTNMQNAQHIAGPGSGNPFAKALPVAGMSAAPGTPSGPATPAAPSAPLAPLPVAGAMPPLPETRPGRSPLTPLPVAPPGEGILGTNPVGPSPTSPAPRFGALPVAGRQPLKRPALPFGPLPVAEA